MRGAAPKPSIGHRNNLAPDSMGKVNCSSVSERCSGSYGAGLGCGGCGQRSGGGGGGGLGRFRARFTAAVGVLAVVAPLGALAQDSPGVSTGFEHSCVVTSTGSVKCFGSNEYGQLGTGDAANRGDGTTGADMGDLLPDVDLGTGAVATAVSAGWSHTCALLEAGTVKCWGRNDFGQLGQGDSVDRGDTALSMGDNLAAIDLGTTPGGTGPAVAVAVTTGQQFTCVLLEGGSVLCFGRNDEGQCGRGDLKERVGSTATDVGDSLQLVDLGTGVEAVSLSSGTASTCAVLLTGSVKCWGGNNYGGLGVGDSYNRGDEDSDMGANLPAVDLGTGEMASSVYYGLRHVCAILGGGKVKCWGDNRSGQLGLGHVRTIGDDDNEMGDSLPALDLGVDGAATRLALGESHTCAILSGDGSVRCWGKAFSGQLGDEQFRARGKFPGEMGEGLSAVSLGTGTSAAAIATGWDHTCAVLDDGGLKCWGLNTVGGLGLGDTRARGADAGEMGDGLTAVSLGTGVTVSVETLPTIAPTASPTASPAATPSAQPSQAVSPQPSQQLSPSPTDSESPQPTPSPTADARSIGIDTPAPTEQGTGGEDTGTAGASGSGSEGGVLSSDNITVAAYIAAPVIAIALLACFCARRRYRQVDAVSASVGARGGMFGKGSGGGGGGGGVIGLGKQHSDRSNRSSEGFGAGGGSNNGTGGNGNSHGDDLSYGGGATSASAGAAAALAAAAAATQAPIASVGGSGKRQGRRGNGGSGGGGMAPHDYAPSYGPDTAFAVTSRAGGGGVGSRAGRGEENDMSDGGGGGGVGGAGTDTGRSNSPSEAEDGETGYGAYGSESAYVSSPSPGQQSGNNRDASPASWRNGARGAVHPEPRMSHDELRRRQDRDQYEAEQDEERRRGGSRSEALVDSRRGSSAGSANADDAGFSPPGANAVAGVPNSSSYFVRERNSDRILARSMHAGRPMSRRGEVHTAIAAAADASRDDRRMSGGRSPTSP